MPRMIFHSRLSSLSVGLLTSGILILSPTIGASGGKPECLEIESRGIHDLAAMIDDRAGAISVEQQQRWVVQAMSFCEEGYAGHGYKDIEECVTGEMDGMEELIKPLQSANSFAEETQELLAIFEENARKVCADLLSNPYLN